MIFRRYLSSINVILGLFLCLLIEGCNGDGDSTPADISGTWSGTIKAGSNLYAVAMTFQQDGNNITGNYAMNFGGSTEGGTLEGIYSAGAAELTFKYLGYTIADAALTFNGNKATGQITTNITDESGTLNLTKE